MKRWCAFVRMDVNPGVKGTRARGERGALRRPPTRASASGRGAVLEDDPAVRLIRIAAGRREEGPRRTGAICDIRARAAPGVAGRSSGDAAPPIEPAGKSRRGLRTRCCARSSAPRVGREGEEAVLQEHHPVGIALFVRNISAASLASWNPGMT